MNSKCNTGSLVLTPWLCNVIYKVIKPPQYIRQNRMHVFIVIVIGFYGAALNAGRSSHEKAVCPSVCLSNTCIVTKRKKVMPTFLYTWKIIYPSFVTNFGLNSPRSSEIAHFQSMFVPSASAVARSKKVQLTLIGCFVRFPLSQYLVRSVTLYVFLLVIYRVTFARTKKFLAYIIYLFIEGHQIFLVHTDTEKLALPH